MFFLFQEFLLAGSTRQSTFPTDPGSPWAEPIMPHHLPDYGRAAEQRPHKGVFFLEIPSHVRTSFHRTCFIVFIFEPPLRRFASSFFWRRSSFVPAMKTSSKAFKAALYSFKAASAIALSRSTFESCCFSSSCCLASRSAASFSCSSAPLYSFKAASA